ncbi:unnamed protein product [Bursaphelenchus okinawaensis]|uniref:Mpv17-like protein 2 n=1 Tax=Bursaphelenchus okinawaensis TaxID=465554 RepID=A0A811KR28_9BILA|nr:unnamed protein product [Bursaphelenchus okinawaensis]CAG9109659.1 unnamed protein product [Bursaphelenchus okinawaensis]
MLTTLKSYHVLIRNTTLTCCISGLADITEQKMVNGKVDWYRAARVSSTGLFLGPMCHGWYKLLDKIFPGPPTRDVILKKVVADFIVIPFFACPFMTYLGLWEGKSLEQCLREYVHKFPSLVKLDICFWPPVQAINFFLLPTHLRVPYVNICQFFYNTCLTYIKHDH